MYFNIKSFDGPLGAEATGVDLSAALTETEAEELTAALRERLVLVVRDQELTPADFVTGMKNFGEPIEQNEKNLLIPGHPEVAELDSRVAVTTLQNGNKMPIGSRDWHTDHTNLAEPPKMTALYAVKLPSSGGDTGFANMQLAFSGLERDEQETLLNMKTVNGLFRKTDYTDDAELADPQVRSQTHPFIRTHPETGNKAIYVHPGKLSHFEGWTPEKSKEFLYGLLDRVITPDIMYRHQWRRGDVVIWDNRALMHLAYNDYDLSEGRTMHRLCLAGDKPV